MPEVNVIRTGQRFDFSTHTEFQQQVQAVLKDEAMRTLIVDLRATQYMDSAALGMLVQLHRKMLDRKSLILKLANAQGAVRETIEIANMQKLYEIV
ncbi:STAS domain-containing protein [Nitrincola alkalilacustris]|uniref:STAS domain-containing protein n=1 Tax=Nitrincola alkalilacustris TaxID=1571224 RepID=UPI00124C8596|nr:STAS domain-containing protein [Nitrincola alkalilacustris]